MALRMLRFITLAWLCFFFVAIQFSSPSIAFVASPSPDAYPKAISDLRDGIVKGLGFQAEDLKISGFDLKDARVGRSVAYEFDIEIDNKVLPLKLLEDVKKWDYVDLPIFRMAGVGDENGLVEKGSMDDQMPVLAPFQLAGPMELWIQDAKDMRVSLPHDVDAGVLKKVILAEGAVVTIKGARSVSLRHPVELPLPLNTSTNGFASGLMALAEHLRLASSHQDGSLLSIRIVGPTSLTSPTSSTPSNSNKLKLKRLAPGLVELSLAKKLNSMETAISAVDLEGESTALLAPDRFTTLWPLASINGSNPSLVGFESLLSSVLGPKANKKGSFKLLKADVSAQTYVKIGFGIEKKLKEGDGVSFEGYPEWRTKPENVRMHFEVIAKVDGDKVVPEKVMQVNPVIIEDSVAPNVLMGNMTMSKAPIVHPPPIPFLL